MKDMLRSEIRNILEDYCAEPALREAMLRAVSREGFALHGEGRCTAGLLTLEVYRAICGTVDTVALRAAVAVELYMEAAFMFDHVADNELDATSGLSAAEELTLAITLMSCGAAVACEAAQLAGGHSRSLDPLLQLQRDCIKSCSGQFLDTRMQKSTSANTDQSLKMTSLKSGSLGRLAAAFGAGIATDDPQTISLFAEFGSDLFTYLQLIDDMRDACPEKAPLKDMSQSKKTLPLAYFYNYLVEEPSKANCDIMSLKALDGNDIRPVYEASGAGVFCAIVAETFLNRAKSKLAVLRNRTRTVEGLEQFVSSLEFSPNEILAVS